MAQTKEGARKVAAKRLGLSFKEYRVKLDEGLKWCTKCRQWKLRDQFGKNKTLRDGLASICLDCATLPYNKKVVGTRIRRQKRNLGLYWCNRCYDWVPGTEMAFASSGDSMGYCQEHYREIQREHYASSPERQRKAYLAAKERREKTKPLPMREKRRLTSIFGGRCAYCQERPAKVWDHVIPVAAGGESRVGNIVPACRCCNTSKLDRDLLEWAADKGILLSDALLSVISMPEETIDYTPYRNRMVIFRGADNTQAAFTYEEIKRIRAEYATGQQTYPEMAIKYAVHHATIGRIIRGETYKDG